MGKTPLVSVCMITYNHEAFISEAIESVLMQQTDFPFELIIGEDISPDHTRSICEAYQAKYPDVVRLLPSEKNIGLQQNFIEVLFSVRGKYIALLDGDDFWTDPHKLQKQVDFLEKNEAYGMVFHNVHLLKHGQMSGLVYPEGRKETISIADILNHDYTQTCATLFRAEPLKKVPYADALQWIYNDITLFALVLSDGSLARYMPETMSTYRVHAGGVWSMVNIRKKYFMSHIAENIIINRYYPMERLKPLITKREVDFYKFYSVQLLKRGEFGLMLSSMFQFVRWSLRHLRVKLEQPSLAPPTSPRAVVSA